MPPLTSDLFAAYPPEARALARDHFGLLSQLPLAFAALLLREVRDYDWRFPPERGSLDDQISFLAGLTSQKREALLHDFAALRLPDSVTRTDWVNAPQQFLDALTACLWSTHQIDGFRRAAQAYSDAWHAARPEPQPAQPRLAIVVLGNDLQSENYPLFRRLRPLGMFIPAVDLDDAWPSIVSLARHRSAARDEPYRHIYIDGGAPDSALASSLTATSFLALEPVRQRLLSYIQSILSSGQGGPEQLRTAMAQLTPAALGIAGTPRDLPFQRFQMDVLTQGAGAQIFATTFVQWAAREALRRAQPYTLVLRFTPRQRNLDMNQMLTGSVRDASPDSAGSLVDADMGAWYTWINQQRLTGASQAAFLTWSEAHRQAVLIGPAIPRNTTAPAPMTIPQLLAQIA